MTQKALFAITGLLVVSTSAFPSSLPKREAGKAQSYSYDKIQASRELSWADCFETFKCAKLKVPLDYAKPDVGDADIAFIKLPSANPDAQDILYNPGMSLWSHESEMY